MAESMLTYVVVNYRAEDLLLQNLRAASHDLRGLDHEILVVDNSAGEGIELARVRREFPEAAVLANPENLGFARAVNQAVQRARGEFVLISNPDAFLTPGTLPRLAEVLRENPRAAVAAPRVINADGSLQGTARRFPSPATAFFGRNTLLTRWFPGNPLTRSQILSCADPGREPFCVDWVAGACALVRRDAFEEVGGFDEDFFLFWEDADLCRRLRDQGREVLYVPACEAVHLVGRSSNTRPYGAIADFHRSVFHYYRKHLCRGSGMARGVVGLGLALRMVVKMGIHLVGSLATREDPGLRVPHPEPISSWRATGEAVDTAP